ncbi:MAG: VWA domain-containing protein, partial [Chloroflexi bacterium]|nr:VWA domain-containing protein [Chloroflexota bacterium]
MEARDLDAEGVWTSELIDISAYSDVSLSVDLSESGRLENTDYIRVYYKLDGGSETLFATNGSNTDDFDNATASQTGLNGSSVVIVIRVKNDVGSEYHRFDNVLVEGTAPPPDNNPDLEAGCGLDVILVLDESGSIVGAGSAGDISQDVRDGAKALIDALADTGAHVTIVEFNAHARTSIGWNDVTSGAGGTVATTFQPYLYDDIGGNGTPETSKYDPEDYDNPEYYTNWEAAFIAVDGLIATAPKGDPPLVVFFTDGNPTAYYNPVGAVGNAANLVTGDDATTAATALSEADAAADVVKGKGSHIFVVGVPNPSVNESNVQAISGPDKYPDEPDFSEADYTLSTSADLVADLRQIAFQLCAPSLTITKQVDEGDGQGYQPASNWEFTADVDVPTGGGAAYSWVAPDDSLPAGDPATGTTGLDGTLSFQWEPDNPVNSAVAVAETPQTGYTLASVSCDIKKLNDPDVQVNPTITNNAFDLTLGPDDIATCIVHNAKPVIKVTKTADPTTVPEPGGPVDFTVVVENESAIPVSLFSLEDLVNSTVTDLATTCGLPVSLAASDGTAGSGPDTLTCTFQSTVSGNADESVIDTVTATARDDEDNEAEDSDDATVTITDVASAMHVVKTAGDAADGDVYHIDEPGGTVTFDVTVYNDSTVDSITIATLNDDVYGDLTLADNSTCVLPQT